MYIYVLYINIYWLSRYIDMYARYMLYMLIYGQVNLIN